MLFKENLLIIIPRTGFRIFRGQTLIQQTSIFYKFKNGLVKYITKYLNTNTYAILEQSAKILGQEL